ncbi:MAG TPA: glycosyltransferase [Gaiellaceae bacterium]|nr:glycosyltransferase [Gaiellaceae bacterium]
MSSSPRPEGLTILVPARDEEERIADTVAALRHDFPDAGVLVLDGRSQDRTAEIAEAAGALVLRLERLGKGEALSAGERAAPAGPLLLADADLRGSLLPLAESTSDLAVAAFRTRVGGGFGIAKRVARGLVRLRTGVSTREPLSGQRLVSARARAACFPLAPGFGCEVRMTIDTLRAGLTLDEVELDLEHRATGRDAAGFMHRGRQLLDAVVAAGPLGINHRGLRLPLLGWTTLSESDPGITVVTLFGFIDDAYGGHHRGFREHLRAVRTTGILKAVGIPLVGLWRTRSLSGALLFALSANLLNQLDTRPGRCLKAYLLAGAALGAPLGRAVLLLPYDLRERAMLGDAGSNAFGAVLGLKSVDRFHGRTRLAAIGVLAGLNLLGERTSLGRLIERTPGLRELDRLGRLP